MKKFLSIIILISVVVVSLSSCMINPISKTTVQITPENFEQYFEISVVYSDYRSDGNYAVIGYSSEMTANITITPKQTITSGSVSVVIEDDKLLFWESEYSTTTKINGHDVYDGIRVPIQFSPDQTYVKTFILKSKHAGMEPKKSFHKIVEASGSITF